MTLEWQKHAMQWFWVILTRMWCLQGSCQFDDSWKLHEMATSWSAIAFRQRILTFKVSLDERAISLGNRRKSMELRHQATPMSLANPSSQAHLTSCITLLSWMWDFRKSVLEVTNRQWRLRQPGNQVSWVNSCSFTCSIIYKWKPTWFLSSLYQSTLTLGNMWTQWVIQ